MRPPARALRLSGNCCQMRPRKNGLHGARTHNLIPRRHPPKGSWHGLALSGTSRAPPLTANLPTGHQPIVPGSAGQGQPARPGPVPWSDRGGAATKTVGAGSSARLPADGAGRPSFVDDRPARRSFRCPAPLASGVGLTQRDMSRAAHRLLTFVVHAQSSARVRQCHGVPAAPTQLRFRPHAPPSAAPALLAAWGRCGYLGLCPR
jgi:hypothetical protein